MIVEAFEEVGLPEGVVNMVTNAPAGAAEAVGALIDHPAARRIDFTGSKAEGQAMAQRTAAFGAFMNQGQICMSSERIIALDAVADAFAENFQAKAASMPVRDPREGKTPLGVVVDRRTVTHIAALVGDVLSKPVAKPRVSWCRRP